MVWYYREVAELLGPEREAAYLEALGLGNARVGDRPEGPAFCALWIEAAGWIPPLRRVQVLDDVRAELK